LRLSISVALCVALAWVPAAAEEPRASPRAATELFVLLSPQEGWAQGRVSFLFANPTPDPLGDVYVWLYPNRLSEPPAALSDVNHYWVYPRRFNPGSMRVSKARADGHALPAAALVPVVHGHAGPGTLLRIVLETPLPPGAEVELALDFTVTIPERYGGFGCTRGRCTLLGGFYPMLAALDPAGFDLAAPPMRSAFSGTVTLTAPAKAVVAGRVTSGAVVPIGLEDAPYVPLVIVPELHESRRVQRGVTLTYLGATRPPPAHDAARQILPYSQEDYAGMALGAAAETIDLLYEIGLPVPEGTHLCIVEAPLRLELASAHPGMVVVSDRAFRLFPAQRFRKFHQQKLVFAVLAEYLSRQVAQAGREGPRDIDGAAEVGASYLTSLYTVRAFKRSEFVRDVLAPVSFVPAVDELLYAQQVAFSDAYFGDVGDGDKFRDDVRAFAHERPRGRVLYEKLRDLLSPEAFAAAMRRFLLDGDSVRASAEQAYGATLGWFFHQWSRRYPKVNYRLGERRRERLGTRWRHRVSVLKEVPPGELAPVEPVTVRVVDGHGKRHDLVWSGAGARGELELVSDAGSLDSVQIDPHARLSETALPGTLVDPRFDDRDPPRWKFLYNNFGALVNLSDFSLVLAADFSFKRVHDTRSSLRFTLFRSSAVTVGGAAAYTRGFGPAVTGTRRKRFASVLVMAQRLDEDFGRSPGDEPRPGTRLALGAGLGSDDRLYIFEPMHARGFSAFASFNLTQFEDEEPVESFAATADLTRIATPLAGHTFVGNLEAAAVAGDLRDQRQLLSAGGPQRLRGYLAGSVYARAMVLLHGEYRFTFRHDLDVNLGQFAWLRGLGGALFADAGALSGCEAYRNFGSSRRLYADVGLGLRMFYDNFGVQPGMLALDLALPLRRRVADCLDQPERDALPFMLYLTFLPPF
jgi:hypothetical protein